MNQEELNEQFFRAAKIGDLDTVKRLLQVPGNSLTCGFTNRSTCGFTNRSTCGFTNRADVHYCNDIALLYSALDGRTEMVQVLLQAGANLHANCDVALLYSAQNGHAEIVQILLQAGANSNEVNFQMLKRFLTPRFVLSLREEIITGLETSHVEVKERYQWNDKISLLKSIKAEKVFESKISLADLYYRPGGPGYHQAISF